MSYLPASKFGDCTQCPAKNTDCVKRGKELWCLQCNNNDKAQKQIKKANQRTAARNTGFKLRNGLAESKGTEDYFMAEKQSLINDCDYVASRICRMIGSDERGICQCYTCPTKKHFSLMQAGHYISRKFTQLRFDLKWNLRPQCPTCNEAKHGNLEVFAEMLEQEQNGITTQLQELSREPFKWDRESLKQLLIDLRAKLRIVENKFK